MRNRFINAFSAKYFPKNVTAKTRVPRGAHARDSEWGKCLTANKIEWHFRVFHRATNWRLEIKGEKDVKTGKKGAESQFQVERLEINYRATLGSRIRYYGGEYKWENFSAG